MSSLKNAADEKDLHALIARTGYILWMLRDSLRQLGIDQTVADVAGSFPEVHDRLVHVVSLTGEASGAVLNSVELAQPQQGILSDGAARLSVRWDEWLNSPGGNTEARLLALDTRAWLAAVPLITGTTHQHLQSIMMAQGLLDLSGQILQRMMAVLSQVEQNLIGVLKDAIPEQERRTPTRSGSGETNPPVSQDDVDDLLAGLGL